MSSYRSHKNDSRVTPGRASLASFAFSTLEQSSAQPPRDCTAADDITSTSSMREISLIETVTSFLEENGASDIDPKVLRNLAEALSKRLDDTSPGGIQDVTMDNSYHFNYRSNIGPSMTSPMAHGRTVREVEKQLSALRKENFNLRLRIYFIEESMPAYKASSSGDINCKEAIAKQLIDSKIEIEMLRKELQEKQDILKEAAQALTQMEVMQKDTEAKKSAEIAHLQERMKHLEAQGSSHVLQSNASVSSCGRVDASVSTQAELVSVDMEQMSHALELAQQENKRFLQRLQELETKLVERNNIVTSCEEKIREQAIQNAELLEAFESKTDQVAHVKGKQNQSIEIQTLKSQLADKICELQEAEDQLKERAKIHEQACRTIQKLMQNVSNQQKEINQLKNVKKSVQSRNASGDINKENTDTNSAANDLECTGLCRSMSDTEAFSELSLSQKQRYELKLTEQDECIKQLRAEIKKKTANLQNLVNRELWEKNREIERLTKLITGYGAPLSPTNTSSNNELQQSFTDGDYSKAMERNKLLQRKVDILIQRLSAERQNESVVSQLRQDLRKAKADADSADKWRSECADVCGVLTNRLEELAGFLNTLLKHKDVLGVLAADRRRAMRRAVDRSLDLSKSLNMTLSISGVSIGDQSLAQLSNLSEILGEVESADRTFDSQEDIHAQTSAIETLKAENKALKKELEKRRSTDGRKERRSLPLPPSVQENQSESEAWSEPDRKVSMARMGLEDPSSSMAKEIPATQQLCTDSDSEVVSQNRLMAKQERNRAHERITQLEQLIAQRDERILSIQCQLVEGDNRLKQENLRVLDLTQELSEARQRNDALHADLKAIGEQETHDSTLLYKMEELQHKFEQLKQERNAQAADAEVSEMQIEALRTELNEMQVNHELALSLAAEQEKGALEHLKKQMETLMQQRIADQQLQHERTLERDWIASTIYDEVKQQLIELQRQYMEALRTIEYHQENEQDLKQALVESEMSTRKLEKQLNESTLQASKTVMERTKANNDKLHLEKRVQELSAQLTQLEVDHKVLVNEMAELQQKQEKQQKQQQQRLINSSDVSQSGYTSEEVQIADHAGATVSAQRAAAVGAQRMNNSSPDLGIESDAGRVSSVELSNAQHELLKTVELFNASGSAEQQASIKEEASAEAQETAAAATAASTTTTTAAITHDCAKVEQENAELRRKLIRTKRAFEDTYEKLRLANKAKAQVEKDIKNQILKTHNVLRNVRSNMENEL